MASFRRAEILLFILMQSTLRLIEAAAAVSFQFLQSYVSIQSEIDEFTSQLTQDLRTKYSFNSQQIGSIQISAADSGAIQINFDLDIDTRNSTQLSQRDILKRDLSTPSYIFTYTNSSTGALNRVFEVDGASASLRPSVWDGWHQYAPDILYASLVGLVLLALFCIAVHCIIAKKRKTKGKYSADSRSRTNHQSNGIDNDGYVVEMTQVYKIKNTQASPIPVRPVNATSLTSPATVTSTQTSQGGELLRPPLVPVSPPTSHNNNTTSTPPSPLTIQQITPSLSQTSGRSPLRVSITHSDSPTPDSFKPPPSPRFMQRLMSGSAKGSLRSLPRQLPGFSTSSTPSSSRKTSITGPSIYARLLYASYSVPPRKIHDFI